MLIAAASVDSLGSFGGRCSRRARCGCLVVAAVVLAQSIATAGAVWVATIMLRTRISFDYLEDQRDSNSGSNNLEHCLCRSRPIR